MAVTVVMAVVVAPDRCRLAATTSSIPSSSSSSSSGSGSSSSSRGDGSSRYEIPIVVVGMS